MLRCRRLVGPDEPLLRLPERCLLSPEAAVRRPLGAAIAAALESDGQPERRARLWALLMELLAARADADHPWHPYAATLPSSAPGALCWPRWRLELFAGTALGRAAAARLSELRTLHDRVIRPLLERRHPAFGGRGDADFGFPRLLLSLIHI